MEFCFFHIPNFHIKSPEIEMGTTKLVRSSIGNTKLIVDV